MKTKSIALAAVLALLLLAVVAAGCGQTLTSKESLAVAEFRVDVSSAVMEANGMNTGDDVSHAGDLYSSAPEVIAIARKQPDAKFDAYDSTLTMRQVLGDAAADLASVDPDISNQLQSAVETLPAQ